MYVRFLVHPYEIKWLLRTDLSNSTIGKPKQARLRFKSMNLNVRLSIPISPDRPIEVGGHQVLLYVPKAHDVISRTTTSMLIFASSEKLTPFKLPWFSHVVWEPFGQLLPWLLRLYYGENK